MQDIRFIKVAVFINSLVPLAVLGWDAYHNQLGANPLEFVTHATGTLTLVFLLISLAVTPARDLLPGVGWLIKTRRMLGLFAFFYAFLHLTTYVWFDKFFDRLRILEDTFNRPFILVGMASFLLMVPLAITSTNKMIKWLGGRRWSQLHKSVYWVGVGGVLHYWLLVKADTQKPLIFAGLLALLLGYRFVVARQQRLPITELSLPSQRQR